ncbi:altronate dehydratase small subunit [Desulfitispora alkaliphila]|uniref:UxaA family hydrolase n=1 Tax=Desulfitispora alkaliphila TaxID=622674 RepID=UPI003D1A9D5B
MAKVTWVVDPRDNVATILGPEVEAGSKIAVEIDGAEVEVPVNHKIVYGHKIAIKPIAKGETILKYGLSLGKATEDIKVGDHVHVHNIESNRGRGDLSKKEAE